MTGKEWLALLGLFTIVIIGAITLTVGPQGALTAKVPYQIQNPDFNNYTYWMRLYQNENLLQNIILKKASGTISVPLPSGDGIYQLYIEEENLKEHYVLNITQLEIIGTSLTTKNIPLTEGIPGATAVWDGTDTYAIKKNTIPFFVIRKVSIEADLVTFTEILEIKTNFAWTGSISNDFVYSFNKISGTDPTGWELYEQKTEPYTYTTCTGDCPDDGPCIDLICTNYTGYRDVWVQIGVNQISQLAGQTKLYKVVIHKPASLGPSSIQVIPRIATVPLPELTWWNASWTKYKTVTLDAATCVNNYAAPLNVTYDADMQADFGDLRFLGTDNTTLYDYWLKEGYVVNGDYAHVYVQVPSSGTSSVLMYYGNAAAPSLTNGDNTFTFFDDANDNSIDGAKWTMTNTIEETGGEFKMTGIITASRGVLLGKVAIDDPSWYHSRGKVTTWGPAFYLNTIRIDTSSANNVINLWTSVTGSPNYNYILSDGDSSSAETEFAGAITSTYGEYKTYWDSDYVEHWQNGGSEWSYNTAANISTASLYAFLKEGYTASTYAYVDWLFARPACSAGTTEPGVTFGDEVSSGEVAPVADFSFDRTFCYIPCAIQATDLSTNTPTSWDWDWGDGTAHGTTEDPTHTYIWPGRYTVDLEATNGAGSDHEIKTNYILVRQRIGPYLLYPAVAYGGK